MLFTLYHIKTYIKFISCKSRQNTHTHTHTFYVKDDITEALFNIVSDNMLS